MTAVPSSRRSRADRLAGHRRFRDEERETLAPADRDAVILDRVRHQLSYAYHRLPFYRRHYDAHGFHPDQVRTLGDFTEKVPVITKAMLVADQAEHPPFGSYLGVRRRDLGRIHGSSGTTGTPTTYGVSVADWARAGQASAAGLWCAGFRPDDVVQVTFPFTLFFGGWGNVQAFELIGACVFPTGAMVPTDRQLELLTRLGCDGLVATPSYLLHLSERAAALGIDPAASSVSLALVGGEPGGSIPSVRATLDAAWGGADVVDGAAGSTSEMYPFLTNIGCLDDPGGGVHLFTDENYTEVVHRDDPNTPVPAGTSGATVATHMGDEGVLDDSGCRCGRTYPKLPHGVYGRLDDMLVIRGANVYPSAVESAIRATPGAGTEFRLLVDRPAALDELTVEVEPAADLPAERHAALTTALAERIRAAVTVRVPVRLVPPGTHEPQTFKARRVLDRRPSHRPG